MATADLQLRADEPAVNGHFPGNPVVPGAVLLREVIRIVFPNDTVLCYEIRSARFFHPVRPGDRLTMRWDTQADGAIAFTGAREEHRIVSGTISLRAR
jgi:3-hydroxymyristoyl/3-hydroxydecanoyl-(acyl carrier protein) dehydratase